MKKKREKVFLTLSPASFPLLSPPLITTTTSPSELLSSLVADALDEVAADESAVAAAPAAVGGRNLNRTLRRERPLDCPFFFDDDAGDEASYGDRFFFSLATISATFSSRGVMRFGGEAWRILDCMKK